MTLTRNEVEALNIHATNHMWARRDEHGMDWDYWTYYPVRIDQGTHLEGGFTDGHDYAGHPMIPDEGWVPVHQNVSVPVEAIVSLYREVESLKRDLHKVATPKKQEDRQSAMWDFRRNLEGLLRHLKPNE